MHNDYSYSWRQCSGEGCAKTIYAPDSVPSPLCGECIDRQLAAIIRKLAERDRERMNNHGS